MTQAQETAALVAEYAGLHRAIRIARGYADMNLDVVVKYACDDLISAVRRAGDGMELLRDEVAFERECLERITAGAR